MKKQVAQVEEMVPSGRCATSLDPFTRIVESILDSEPQLRLCLRSIILEHIDRRSRSTAQRLVEELLREQCESHAGLDVNENDMLAPLARELLLLAFSSVNWGSLAEWLVEKRMDRSPDRRDGG